MKVKYTADYSEREEIEMVARSGKSYLFPYAAMDPRPTTADPIRKIYVDRELAQEGVTYVLASGAEGAVLLDHVFSLRREQRRAS